MQFIDLKAQHQLIKTQLDERMNRVYQHGQFILGPEVKELEQKLAEYVGAECITVANGTDALQIALMALEIKPGDEVITSAFTFIAVAEMIALLGAKPVFVDIDSETYNLDPKLLEKAITSKTKAIIPICLYGQCADLTKINQIAAKYHLPVIEDAAQSFGGKHKGKLSCSMTTIACTSFYPSKPLACYGDGGACFTHDAQLAEKMRLIRNHGQPKTYYHTTIGLNSRLDTLQAAVLLAKFEIFEKELQQRQVVAQHYNALLDNWVATPKIDAENFSAYAQYTIKTKNRDELRSHLQTKNIPTAVHYPMGLHLQPVFQYLGYKAGDFPNTEHAAASVVSLPMHPYLQREQIKEIADAIIDFQQQNSQIKKAVGAV